MRTFSKSAIIILALAICSCSLFKDYEPALVQDIDDLYGLTPSDTTTLADMGWRDFFRDPLLQDLIEKGLAENLDLLTAGQKVVEAQATLEASRKAFFPSVTATPSVTYSIPVSNFSFGNMLTASWETDINAQLTNRRRQAQTAYDQALIYERTVKTELVSSIADLYYTLLKLDAQLLVSQTTAASWKENVRIMKSMKEAGMTNEASVSQTEANACSIVASLFDLDYQIHQIETSLCTLTGMAPCHIERGTLADAVLPEELLYGVPAQLLSRRPDVMMAEKDIQAAYYGKQIARGAFYPALTINAAGTIIPENWLASLGAGLVQPIFARGTLKANLTVAEARQQEAAYAFRKALLTAGAEVSNALALCQSAKGKADLRTSQIEALESAVNSTKQLMRHSESTYLEVLTAQQSLLSAQLLKISDRFDEIEGTIALYKALGGGAE